MRKFISATVLFAYLLAWVIPASAQLSQCSVSAVAYSTTGALRAGVVFRVVRVIKSGVTISAGPRDYITNTSGVATIVVPRASTAYIYADFYPYNTMGTGGVPISIPNTPTANLADLSYLASTLDTLGQILYGGNNGVPVALNPNTSTTFKMLGQVGTGSAGQAPGWFTPLGSGTLTVAADNSAKTVTFTYAPSASEINTALALTASRLIVTNGSGSLAASSVTATEAGYLSGVTSAIQTQIDSKQASDADLSALAGLAGTSGFLRKTAANTWALDTSVTPTEFAYLAGVTSAVQTQLDARQPLDSDLTAIAALSTTSFGRGLLAETNAASLRTTAGLVIGTDVAAYDPDLTTYAGITPSANVQTLLSAANYAAFKTSLSLNNVENTALSTWAGTTNITTLGTIATGVLTGATGLPISTGLTGLGTGVATALGVNVGSAGAFVVNGGALGTPSSGTLTNATGLPPTTGISGWPANASGVLTNNGSGALSWGAGGGTTINSSDGFLPYRSNSTTFADSPISRIDSTTVQVAAINGGAAANDYLTLQGTSHATRTTSYVNLQPNGGNVGIATNAPGKALEVNSATGANLRLTYNDADGSAANYADLSTTSGGDLMIAPSGGDTNITGTLAVSSTLNGATLLTANTNSLYAVSGGTPALTSGTENTAAGYQALSAITNTFRNTAFGYQALKLNTGYYNTALGAGAAAASVNGWNLTAIGRAALAADTSGGGNTAVGALALTANTSGSLLVAIGYRALVANTTATSNTAIGHEALAAADTGGGNTAIGKSALATNTSGTDNVAIGSSALVANLVGVWNMAVGTNALAATTGSNNTAVGVNAGFANTTGGSNTFIGQAADASTGGLSKATAIGYGAVVAANNALVLGGTGSNAVNVGINTTTPAAQLDVRPSAIGTIGQIIRLASGQTANALNIENSTGTLLSSINKDGLWVNSGTPQTLTGPGAVNLTTYSSLIVTTGADALTLAAGSEGQTKFIRMKTDGGDGTLTVTNGQGFTTITFNDAGDFVLLFYQDAKWHVLTNSGCTVA